MLSWRKDIPDDPFQEYRRHIIDVERTTINYVEHIAAVFGGVSGLSGIN
jgi:hypothetical protein